MLASVARALGAAVKTEKCGGSTLELGKARQVSSYSYCSSRSLDIPDHCGRKGLLFVMGYRDHSTVSVGCGESPPFGIRLCGHQALGILEGQCHAGFARYT